MKYKIEKTYITRKKNVYFHVISELSLSKDNMDRATNENDKEWYRLEGIKLINSFFENELDWFEKKTGYNCDIEDYERAFGYVYE